MITVQGLFFRPLLNFFKLQSSSTALLLGATGLALAWANSPWAEWYERFWHLKLTLGLGRFQFQETLHFWINDALMAIFFLVVGLEIKRELQVGELSSPRQAALPIVAALGGILVPTLVYLAFNPPGSLFQQGWGIPTVTDIAFAIGVLTILGSRVPWGLKVFLTALAIVDDLGAILLIAIFYSQGIQIPFLLAILPVMAGLLLLNKMGVTRLLPYLLLGIALWVIVLNSGLHATIAGVLLALTIPARGKIDPSAFYKNSQSALQRFFQGGTPKSVRYVLTNHEHQASIQELETLCEKVQAPLQRLEHTLSPWSSFVILPLFALANAGVSINLQNLGNSALHPITLGVVFGLIFGKQIGITLFAWISVKLGLAELPHGVRWSGIYGASILGGIGFTMALFITLLAFTDPIQVDYAKIAVLFASLLSGILGTLVLYFRLPSNHEHSAKKT